MIPWNCEILRSEVVALMCSVEGKLRYTQGKRRDNIEEGFADCSSVVRWAYKKVLLTDIGEDTAKQIVNNRGIDVDCGTKPDILKLLPGDLLFFTGGAKTRPYEVGHVEMYMGDGLLVGQNDRPYPGTTKKHLYDYVEEIEKRGHFYIKARRFIGI